jgi:hypothetical protein
MRFDTAPEPSHRWEIKSDREPEKPITLGGITYLGCQRCGGVLFCSCHTLMERVPPVYVEPDYEFDMRKNEFVKRQKPIAVDAFIAHPTDVHESEGDPYHYVKKYAARLAAAWQTTGVGEINENRR